MTDIKDLKNLGLLVTSDAGGVAVLNGRGWVPIPSPLRELCLRALGVDDDAA